MNEPRIYVWEYLSTSVICECGRHRLVKRRSYFRGSFTEWAKLFAECRLRGRIKIATWYDKRERRRVVRVLIGDRERA